MSILFPDATAFLTSIKATMAFGMADNINIAALPDADITAALEAAEAEASRRLRVLFQPTAIIPDDAAQTEIDSLVAAQTPYMQEASYDYDPDFFVGNRWGYIVLKERPVVSVQSIRFAYPAPTSSVFDIPNDWIRLDKRFGQIRLIPATQQFAAPLSAFVLQALGGGRTVPFMIQVRYTAGLTDPGANYPDLLDLVKKMTMYRLLLSAFLPASGSISADGLSQSSSFDYGKWEDALEAKFDNLRDAIHGPRLSVLGVA